MEQSGILRVAAGEMATALKHMLKSHEKKPSPLQMAFLGSKFQVLSFAGQILN